MAHLCRPQRSQRSESLGSLRGATLKGREKTDDCSGATEQQQQSSRTAAAAASVWGDGAAFAGRTWVVYPDVSAEVFSEVC